MVRILAIPVMVLVIAGCASDATPPSTTIVQATSTTTTVVATTVPPTGDDPGDTTTTTIRIAPEGAPAPDFTLDLDGGGSFSLSAETKPVLLVFWAEWCPK